MTDGSEGHHSELDYCSGWSARHYGGGCVLMTRNGVCSKIVCYGSMSHTVSVRHGRMMRTPSDLLRPFSIDLLPV
jgi:hypothetical protein